jgi:hypothetical protein
MSGGDRTKPGHVRIEDITGERYIRPTLLGYESLTKVTGSQNVVVGHKALTNEGVLTPRACLVAQQVCNPASPDYGVLITEPMLKKGRSSAHIVRQDPQLPSRFHVGAPRKGPFVDKHDAQGIVLAIIVAGLVTILTVAARYIS